MELADRAQQEFTQRQGTVGGVVTLGMAECLGAAVLAKFVRRFSKATPRCSLPCTTAWRTSWGEAVDQGSIDLALVLEPVDTTKYEFLRLSPQERWGVLVREDHPFARRGPGGRGRAVGPAPSAPLPESIRRKLLHWIGKEEQQLRVVLNYNILSNTVLTVEEGLGVAVCLNGALAIHHSLALRFVPLAPERSIRSLLIWKRGHVFNPATSLFVQMLYQSLEDRGALTS